MFDKMMTSTLPWLARQHFVCCAEGDGGAGAGGAADGGGSGSASGDGGAPPPPPAQNWPDYINALGTLNENLTSKLDELTGTVRELPRATEQPQAPPDLESMSRAEFSAYIAGTIVDTIQERINAALQPVTEQVTQVQSRLTEGQVQEEVNRLSAQHKDFRDWKPEMIALANVHPTLTVTQLYSLARAENAEKARTLDAKHAPPPAPRPPRFGGLAPGMPGGPPLTEKPMSAREAGAAAYREVQARYPGVLAALEDL